MVKAALYLSFGVTALALRVNPVEKVTELLTKLKQKTIDSGKREKELFGKFNDYCHQQEDDKFWRAAKGAKKVDRLDQQIESLVAQIEKKTRKIESLDNEIAKNNDIIADQTKEMEDRSEADASAIGDLDTVISQCQRAIEHLSASDVSKTGFTQLISLLESSLALKKPPRELQDLATELLQEPGKPHAFKFHSTVVIKLLEGLLTEFKNQRVAKDNEALQSRSQSEHSINEQKNLVASQTHQKDEFQGEVDEHSQEKQEKEADRALTAKNLFADADFEHHLVGCAQFAQNAEEKGARNLSEYLPKHLNDHGGCPSDIGECGKKRENYAARVKTREEEVEALTKAIELMQGEGGTSYKANKRLVGFAAQKQKRTIASMMQDALEQVQHEQDEDMMEEHESSDFLQLSRRDSGNKRLIQFLTRKASEFKSTVLSSLLLTVKMQKKDHFKKIRQIINDMIEKLENQVESEQKQKDWCDTQLKATHEKRNAATADIETATSNIDSETAARNLLNKEIGELRAQIATDLSARKSATDLRNDEKAENEATVEDAREGLSAVSEAIKVLNAFYTSNAGNEFLQGPEKVTEHVEYRAQGEGADGKTIADTRPESDNFDTKYAGNQNESKGIIGILEVIQTDYDRTVETVEADEKKSNEEWKADDERLKSKIEDAQGTVSAKSDESDAAQEAITANEGDLQAAQKEFQLREEELETLKPLCSAAEAEEQKEERRKRREQEVASLREALTILREYSM